jgi:hypothetical protein
MHQEADIRINGSKLTDNKAMVVRVRSLPSPMSSQRGWGFKDDGIALTDQYQANLARVQALIFGKMPRAP